MRKKVSNCEIVILQDIKSQLQDKSPNKITNHKSSHKCETVLYGKLQSHKYETKGPIYE